MADERDERAGVVATLLARCCRLHPAGFAAVDVEILAAAAPLAAAAALGRILATIGGGDRPPGADKLERLRRRLNDAGAIGGGLGRCRLWWRRRARHGGPDECRGGPGGLPSGHRVLMVCREARDLPPPVELEPATTRLWDGRFAIEVGPAALPGPTGIWLGALGEAGWRQAIALDPSLRDGRIPWQAAVTMPALGDRVGLLAVPALGVHGARTPVDARLDARIAFQPLTSLSATSYFLA